MKITGGSARGRIVGPARKNVRPTSSKVREALFNILDLHIKSARFVDLYAGTGIMGCEALSRGAKEAFFVEKSKLSSEGIRKAVKALGFEKNAFFFVQNAYQFIEEAQKTNQSFDIIFMDPPYYSDDSEKLLALIDKRSVLNDEGLLICEHFHKKLLPQNLTRLSITRQRRYGDTILSIYRKIPLHSYTEEVKL